MLLKVINNSRFFIIDTYKEYLKIIILNKKFFILGYMLLEVMENIVKISSCYF